MILTCRGSPAGEKPAPLPPVALRLQDCQLPSCRARRTAVNLKGARMKKTPLVIVALALGWTVSAAAAQPATAPSRAAACDRECLRGAITAYLHALVRHDVSQLPLAGNIRITEDSIEKTIDEVGLVRSVTKMRGYRQDFLDEREGIAGSDVVVEEKIGRAHV